MRGRILRRVFRDLLVGDGGDGAGGNGEAQVEGEVVVAAAGNAEQGGGPAAATEAAATAMEYGDFSVPEGFEINPELLGEFKTTLAGMQLSQEQAQLLTDLGVKQAQSLLGRAAELSHQQQTALAEAFRVGEGSVKAAEYQQPEFIKAQTDAWIAAVKADKELGGDRLAENLATAKKALNALGSPQLQELLDKSGLGSHPDLIRAFYKAGKMIAEDGVVMAGHKPAAAATGRTAHEQAAHRLYGG